MPTSIMKQRQAFVLKPSRHAMQSGEGRSTTWMVKFLHDDVWNSNLMGWNASSDPVGSLKLYFESKEDAIRYCENQSNPNSLG